MRSISIQEFEQDPPPASLKRKQASASFSCAVAKRL